MADDLLKIDHIIILLIILIVGVLLCAFKREPEPFKNMIESGRSFYNKHRRLIRTSLEDTNKTLTDRVKTRMRLAGF